MALMRVSTASPGDEIALRAGARWEDAERGTIDYSYFSSEAMNRGILRNNPSRESKYVVCFAEVASHLDFDNLGGLDDIACDWIPIPDHVVVEVLRQKAATPTDKGFGDWVRGLVPKKFRQEPPQRVVGLPVPQEHQGELDSSERYPEEYQDFIDSGPEYYGEPLARGNEVIDLPVSIEEEQEEEEEYEDALMKRIPTPGEFGEDDDRVIEGDYRIINGDMPPLPEGHAPTVEETPEERRSRRDRLKDYLKTAGDYTLDTADQAGRLAGDLRRGTGKVLGSEEAKEGGKFGGRLLKRAGQYGSSLFLSTLRQSETGKLMRIGSVQPGQNIMFVADEGVHGIERGDRGQVRMGPRGKDKVVYIPDTGEIKYPSQWTLVSLVGMIQDPNIGSHNLGLGLYGESLRYGIGTGRAGHQMIMPKGQGYTDDRLIRIGPNWVGTINQWLSLTNEDKIRFGGGADIVGAREGTALRRAFNQANFGYERLSAKQGQRTYRMDGQDDLQFTEDQIREITRRMGQAGVDIFSGDEDAGVGQAIGLHRGQGRGSKVVFNSRLDPESGDRYLEVVIPYGRLPSELQVAQYRRKGVVVKTSKSTQILWAREGVELGRHVAKIAISEGREPEDIEVRFVSSGAQEIRGDDRIAKMQDMWLKKEQGEQLTDEEAAEVIQPTKTVFYGTEEPQTELIGAGTITLEDNEEPYY